MGIIFVESDSIKSKSTSSKTLIDCIKLLSKNLHSVSVLQKWGHANIPKYVGYFLRLVDVTQLSSRLKSGRKKLTKYTKSCCL